MNSYLANLSRSDAVEIENTMDNSLLSKLKSHVVNRQNNLSESFVAVPTNLDVNSSKLIRGLSASDHIDMTNNNLSDCEIARYENSLREVEDKLRSAQSNIKTNSMLILNLVEECYKLEYAKTNPTTYKQIDNNLLSTVNNLLDPSTLACLQSLNSILANDVKSIDVKIEQVKNQINNLRTEIESDLKSLNALTMEKVSAQSKLMQAQTRYIRAFTANPPKIMSGDEIVRNYMETELTGGY